MTPRQAMRAARRMGPYLVSHHPHCGPFRSDVVVVGTRRFCIACFVGYPAIVLGLVAGVALEPTLDWPWWLWSVAGLAIGSVQALSFMGRIRRWPTQVLVKLALGVGLGLFILGGLLAPWPLWARVATVVVALAAIQSLWVLRFHRLERTCQTCPQLALRPHCEGLADLTQRVGDVLGLESRRPSP